MVAEAAPKWPNLNVRSRTKGCAACGTCGRSQIAECVFFVCVKHK